MHVQPLRTSPVRASERTLESLLDEFVPNMEEHQVLVITSKVVSLCEGNVRPVSGTNRQALVEQEADAFVPPEHNPYGFSISIKNNTLIASAGIDESNGDDHFILWPAHPQTSANQAREHLCRRFHLKEIGVIITDSHVLPLRWGTLGTCLAHSGFLALNNYIGTPDIFGRKLKVTRANVSEGLAAAAVVAMGEGSEQTPLALINEVPFVQFQDRNPSEEELKFLAISPEEDIFWPILKNGPWVRK